MLKTSPAVDSTTNISTNVYKLPKMFIVDVFTFAVAEMQLLAKFTLKTLETDSKQAVCGGRILLRWYLGG